jgi:hypothetical protein
MTLKHIRIELARDKNYPEGDPRHSYDFIAPVSADGYLEAKEFAANRAVCTVRRNAPGEEEEHGHLIHTGQDWRFDYDSEGADDDEPLFKLDRHCLVIGEYISVREWDGQTRTFKVVQVMPLIL